GRRSKKKQEARSKKQEARSKKQEARSKKQEARSKKQEARSKNNQVSRSGQNKQFRYNIYLFHEYIKLTKQFHHPPGWGHSALLHYSAHVLKGIFVALFMQEFYNTSKSLYIRLDS